jgi:hypothetical protein
MAAPPPPVRHEEQAAPAAKIRRLRALRGGLALLALGLLCVAIVIGLDVLFHRFRGEVPYRVLVSSGDPVLKRGESVTLTAYLDPTRPDAALPGTASLVIRAPGQSECKSPMVGDASAAFHINLPAASEGFEYRVEAGAAHSDWHAVSVVDPVALADGSTVTIEPPKYAGVVAAQTHTQFAAFEALQFSRLTASLRFTHPATTALLRWQPAVGSPETVPIRLTEDRLAGTVEWPLTGDGTLVLVLDAERGVRTTVSAEVRAVADAPPQFEKVTGLTAGARDARPDDRIPIELAARDDVRIDAARVEYCVNGNEANTRTEPVPLTGIGTKRVEGIFNVPLAGKVREGETLSVRLRVTDNRSVPLRKLGAQDAVFPADGWAVLRITSSARPLVEQEFLAQRDKAANRLTAATELVTRASAEVGVVRANPPGDQSLALDQVIRLRTAREKCTEAVQLLDHLATSCELTPDLRPFAGSLRALTANSLREAAGSLRTAQTDPARPLRETATATAAARLEAAFAELTALSLRNRAIARARLDRHALRQIADDQSTLLSRAEQSSTSAEELARAQRDLLARLNEAVAESGWLRDALDAAAGAELRHLLTRVQQLADDQALLNRTVAQTDAATRKERTGELARRQRALGEQAAKLAARTATAARLAKSPPLGREPFDKAARELELGDAGDALAEQEKAARELDRLADALAGAAAARGDPREAARQIARWQDDLGRRYAEAVRAAPKETLAADVRRRFAAEERQIAAAVALLRPTSHEWDDAAAALATKPEDAPEALKQAAAALAKLVERTPSREQRLQAARAKLEQLRREQEAIGRDADDALRAAARDAVGQKLDAAAARQDALARRLRQLNTPGQELRRDRAASTAGRAAADLRSGLALDIPASQRQVRQQLDRLRHALDGAQPADELADELARAGRHVAEAMAKLTAPPSADELRALQQKQREITHRLAALHDADTTRAVRDAADAVNQHGPPDKLRKATQAAADALTHLAARLNGAESELRRVERLARAPATDAQQAQRQLAELERTRVGKAQAAMRAALAALRTLQQQPTDARRRDAADALRRLAAEMARHGDRATPHAFVGPPPPTDADALRRLCGRLPADRDAAAALALARRQRELRDAASHAAAELSHGTRPAATDPLGPLAQEQEELAKASRNESAQAAARYLRTGAVKLALQAATEAEAKLPRELASRQAALSRRIRKLTGDSALAAARQRHRQEELAAAAGRLNESLRDAIDRRLGTTPSAEDVPLAQAATAARQASEKMTQAARGAAAGRAADATTGRQQAAEQLGAAAVALRRAAGSLPRALVPDAGNRATGDAVRRAGEAMKRADAQLGGSAGRSAGTRSMRQASAALGQAITELNDLLANGTHDE